MINLQTYRYILTQRQKQYFKMEATSFIQLNDLCVGEREALLLEKGKGRWD